MHEGSIALCNVKRTAWHRIAAKEIARRRVIERVESKTVNCLQEPQRRDASLRPQEEGDAGERKKEGDAGESQAGERVLFARCGRHAYATCGKHANRRSTDNQIRSCLHCRAGSGTLQAGGRRSGCARLMT